MVEQIRQILTSPEVVSEAVRAVRRQREDIDEAEAIQILTSIDTVWDALFPAEQASVIRTLIERITIKGDELLLEWKDQGLATLLYNHRKTHRLEEVA